MQRWGGGSTRLLSPPPPGAATAGIVPHLPKASKDFWNDKGKAQGYVQGWAKVDFWVMLKTLITVRVRVNVKFKVRFISD